MQRQVEDLVAKSLIQESKSPCAAPALLSWCMCGQSYHKQDPS